jgi:hypothetical protein
VAADDLVEALPGQRLAAEVDEQLRLEPAAQQARAAALDVDARGLDRGLAHGHDTLLRPLAARAEHAGLEVEVAQVHPDGLRGAEAARIHELEQRAVAQRCRLGAVRLDQQLLHLGAVQDLRHALAAARAGDRRGGVALTYALAAQVAVERAQAGRLAVHGGR